MEHESRSLAHGRGQVVWWGASRLCDSIGSAPTGRQQAADPSRRLSCNMSSGSCPAGGSDRDPGELPARWSLDERESKIGD